MAKDTNPLYIDCFVLSFSILLRSQSWEKLEEYILLIQNQSRVVEEWLGPLIWTHWLGSITRVYTKHWCWWLWCSEPKIFNREPKQVWSKVWTTELTWWNWKSQTKYWQGTAKPWLDRIKDKTSSKWHRIKLVHRLLQGFELWKRKVNKHYKVSLIGKEIYVVSK